MKTARHILNRMTLLLSRSRVQLVILILTTIICFIPIFGNGFVWDDHDLIENWPEIRSWQNLPRFLTQATNPNYPDTYRPVRYVFSIFLYQLFGTSPVGYHLTTLLIHLTVTLLVYKLFGLLTKQRFVPFIGALVFGVHPVHTEAITWISSGLDMIGIALYLLSIVFALDTKHVNNRFVSVFIGALAYFTLELTVTLPIILFVCVLSIRKANRTTIPLASVIPYVLTALVYLFIRWRVVGIQEVFGYLDGSLFRTLLVMARAFLVYCQVLIFPVHLTVNHVIAPSIPSFMVETGESFPTVLTAIRSITVLDPWVITSGLTITSLLILCLWAWKRHSLLSLAVMWFFITLAPFSNIIPGHTIMAERYLYLPSVGFCLAVAYILYVLHSTFKHTLKTYAIFLVFGAVIIGFMILTVQRNKDWQSDLTLMKTTARDNPYSYIAHVGVAKQYLARKQYQEAIREYRHVLLMYPEQKRVAGLLAELYIRTGQYAEARDLVQSVTIMRPDDVATWLKLGDIYRAMNDTESANAAYRQALIIDPLNAYAISKLR